MSSTDGVTRDWLLGVPKAELHCHLDGSLRPETLWELSQEQRVSLPVSSAAGIQRFFTAEKSSLSDYLQLFEYTLRVLQQKATIRRAVVELIHDFASENGVYIEIRYAPLLHLHRGLKPHEVVEATIEGLEQGRKETGVRGGLILCAMRQDDPQRAMQVAQLAIEYREAGVAAFDLAGPERGYPPEVHRRALERVKEAGLSLTIHAGEEPCPGHIGSALALGADRIGHGLYLQQAPDAVRREIVDREIALEMCPTSNLQTAHLDDYAEHPIMEYHKQGVIVTVNTDNRLMSNTTLTDELFQIASAFGLGRVQVKEILLNSAHAAFVPQPAQKRRLLDEVKAGFG